jgi:hypothetical protein
LDEPLDAILFLHDRDGGFHARVVHREQVPTMPVRLRAMMEEFDQCGRFLALDPPILLVDLPDEGRNGIVATPPIFEDEVEASDESLLRKLQELKGGDGRESAGQRHRRSRLLAETLKRLYKYRCQLCNPRNPIPQIDMGDGRFYCEVHHIDGFSEVDEHLPGEINSQETALLNVDRAENLIVVCAYHHMLLHHRFGGFAYDRAKKEFHAPDSTRTGLVMNRHQ